MPRYSAATALRDHLKPFLRCLPRKKHGLFLALCRGLLSSGKANLSEACRSAGGGRICRWVERSSLLLEHLPWDVLLARHDHRLRQRQKNWRLIVTDTTALPKPWAEEMEGLSLVYDGCTGETVNGYTVAESIGVGGGAWDIHPIRSTLINPKAKGFRSQNIALQEHATEILDAGIGEDLLHVYDRGFDDEKHFHSPMPCVQAAARSRSSADARCRHLIPSNTHNTQHTIVGLPLSHSCLASPISPRISGVGTTASPSVTTTSRSPSNTAGWSWSSR